MKLAANIIFVLLFFSATPAQSTYLMNFTNPQQANDKAIEFDINIKSTNNNFILTSYQCAFIVNQVFVNDTSFCFEYIQSTSQLTNPPAFGVGCTNLDGSRIIHFASSAGKDSITSIPLKVGRFRIKKSSSIRVDSLQVNWSFDGIYRTILTGENFQEITIIKNHTNLFFINPTTTLNNFIILKAEDGILNGNVHLKIKDGSINSQVAYFLNSYSTITLSVDLDKTGEWYAWGRMFFDSEKDLNSFYIQIDGGTKFTFGNSNTFNKWHWEGSGLKKLSLGLLTQGLHAITIFGREPSETVMLDQILLSTDETLIASDDLLQTTTPVELVSFNATNSENNKIELSWITSTEINNYGFFIERSVDNSYNWSSIGFIKGNGTTTLEQHYFYLDKITYTKLFYRIKQIDNDGSFQYSQTVEINNAPQYFFLSQNFPNPFNPSTKIKYTIPSIESHHTLSVQLTVYDILGNEIATLLKEEQTAGNYEVNFDASNLSSGTYLYSLTAGNYSQVKKMQLLK